MGGSAGNGQMWLSMSSLVMGNKMDGKGKYENCHWQNKYKSGENAKAYR